MAPVTEAEEGQLDPGMATEAEVAASVAAHVIARHTPTNPSGTDDFMGGVVANALGWASILNGAASLAMATTVGVTADKPGRWEIRAGSTNASRHAITLGLASIILGGGAYAQKWMWQLQALIVAGTNNYTHAAGLMDIVPAEPPNGVYLWYSSANANWQCKTAAAGTRTVTDSGIPVVAGADVTFEPRINAAGTSVEFWINGTLVATHTTNIPTSPVGPAIYLNRVTPVNASRSFYIDFFDHVATMTTPR